jgi:hypothetical protein
MKRNFFLTFWVFWILVSCGYQIEGRPVNFSPQWHSVYVPVWENPTSDIRFGQIMAEALRERIELAGDLKLASEEEADLILQGKIVSVWVSGLSFNEYTQTLERRVSVRARASLVERKTGRVIWQNDHIYRYEDYPVVYGDLSSEEIDPGRDLALEKISRDLAEIIYHQIISSF